VALYGGGPTTPEVLGWIFGNNLDKRYWSFGSNKATSKIYGEGIAIAAPTIQDIRVTPLLDGDSLIKNPDGYIPITVPPPANELTYFPFWELENVFLSNAILDKVIPTIDETTGSARFWTSVEENQTDLLISVKKTVGKNTLRRFSLDNYIDTDPQADIERWKTEIQGSTTDLALLDKRFTEIIATQNWRWIPGKESLPLAVSLEPDFWNKLRDLHQKKELKPLLESESDILTFINTVNTLTGRLTMTLV
jgi:hypothetical protein